MSTNTIKTVDFRVVSLEKQATEGAEKTDNPSWTWNFKFPSFVEDK
ncbi:MAG TPA: hypothetical protein V6D25_06800 [Leptolyngbyaceae cyanobacterium]